MTRIIAKHVSVTLGQSPILSDISLSLDPGVFTVILGANGAGKSTLLSALCGLTPLSTGEVRLEDTDLAKQPPRWRAQRLGFLPQQQEVAWAIDVQTLVGLGRTPFLGARGLSLADQDHVSRAMAATCVEHLAKREVGTLSGGERGRAMVARVLAGEPLWVLADEPLTGLDPRHQLDMLDLLAAIAKTEGRGVVATLHDLGLAARVAERIIVLRQGQVLADGPPEHALSAENLRLAYGVETAAYDGRSGPIIEVLGRCTQAPPHG